jgi:hypothetical protein
VEERKTPTVYPVLDGDEGEDNLLKRATLRIPETRGVIRTGWIRMPGRLKRSLRNDRTVAGQTGVIDPGSMRSESEKMNKGSGSLLSAIWESMTQWKRPMETVVESLARACGGVCQPLGLFSSRVCSIATTAVLRLCNRCGLPYVSEFSRSDSVAWMFWENISDVFQKYNGNSIRC